LASDGLGSGAANPGKDLLPNPRSGFLHIFLLPCLFCKTCFGTGPLKALPDYRKRLLYPGRGKANAFYRIKQTLSNPKG
jgi:hypothetical protein